MISTYWSSTGYRGSRAGWGGGCGRTEERLGEEGEGVQREGHGPEGELEEPEEVVRQPRHTRQRAPAPPREFNAKPDTFPTP